MGILFKSLRKSWELKKISKILGESILDDLTEDKLHSLLMGDIDELMQKKNTALIELVDLCMSDPQVVSIMKKYNASRETLYELFNKLNKNGADRWVRGHFIAASALVFPQTLEYILRNANGDFNMLSARLLIYFARNETGQVE